MRASRAFLFALVVPSICYAWGTEGHQIVGRIATEYLTDTAKREIAVLLENDLDASGAPSGRTTLAEIGSWPDEIRANNVIRPV